MRSTRRGFLRSTSAAGATAVGGHLVAGRVAASHLDVPGENVTLEYDQGMLDTYRPRLVIPTAAREKLIGIYGWVAKSADFETDVCCYWTKYTHQEGFLGNLDSHDGDHEPLQVEVDSTTGDVTRVRASVYHLLKAEVQAASAPLYEETHPHLRVIEPWHQYTAARPSDEGAFLDVKDLTSVFPRWLDNGLESALHPGSTTVPWRMRDRGSWWRDTIVGVSFAEQFYRGALRAGLDTAGSLEATG